MENILVDKVLERLGRGFQIISQETLNEHAARPANMNGTRTSGHESFETCHCKEGIVADGNGFRPSNSRAAMQVHKIGDRSFCFRISLRATIKDDERNAGTFPTKMNAEHEDHLINNSQQWLMRILVFCENESGGTLPANRQTLSTRRHMTSSPNSLSIFDSD